MKKMNLTFQKLQIAKLFFGCLFMMLGVFTANSQCTLACNGTTNISLDNMTSNCQAVITVGMVADTSGCVSTDLSVLVYDLDGNVIPNATITSAYIGQTLEVVVLDGASNNSCWGNILIEDKLPPVLDCTQGPSDITCYDLQNFMPVATDNCDTDIEMIKTKPDSIVLNDCTDPNVSDDVLKTVFVTYIAVDDQGLESDECTFEFSVLRISDFTTIQNASSLLLQNDTHLECDSVYNKLPNGLPSPLDLVVDGQPTIFGTGVPTLGGTDLYPNSFEDCNLSVTYSDTELPPIGCAKKIMRKWDIIEWSYCSAQRDTSFIQMIEIVDNEGPTFACPADYTISTNGSSCEASVLLPSVDAYDNCSAQSALTYGVAYGNGPALNTNGGLAQLQLGANIITYTVYDECLNLNSCTFTITVADNTPPVVICDQNTTVALTSDGCAYVHASVFDDGSYDECTDVTFTVRRMDDGVPCETNSNCTQEDDELFDSYVRFCCVDQAGDVMVVLRATDANGNVNDCMVNVEVQDKLAPTVTCPGPMQVNCDFGFDLDNLSAAFGDYVVSDNCGNEVPTDVIDLSDLNQCNIGTAVRTISVGTPGTANFSSCTQQITFVALETFNYTGDDIDWPEDPDPIEGCDDPTGAAYLPENLPVGSQFPTYNEGACDLVGANYEDQIFPFNNSNGDACFKIVRTWTVIDWCQLETYNSNGGSYGSGYYPKWTYVQIIKVNDSQGPEEIVTTGPESVCTFDSDCADGSIELGATSSDVCTEFLDWSYVIYTDGDNDDKLDDILIVNGIPQSFSGLARNSIDASGTYPIGTHKVLYTFSDKCGNITSKEFIFSIVNCKAPTAYCHNGLAVDLMEAEGGGGTVQLWATDFDAGSSHPCGYDVYVSFDSIFVSETGNIDAGNGIKIVVNNGKEYTCENFGDNFVDIWAASVTPEGMVIQSYCTATLNVQDNMGVCNDDGDGLRVEGSISTTSSVELENAEVELLGSEFSAAMTDELGEYAFPLMPSGGAYSISPVKNDDYKNGVSTLDLVMIQRHILGLEELATPYKIIAADINNDEDLDAGDLLELRKLILGTITTLPNNGSWRFIDADYTFTDETKPLDESFPESYDIEQLNSDMDIDFVAVKVGDINDNSVANLRDQEVVSTRSNNSIAMVVENQNYVAGSEVIVPVVVAESMIATGLQFTLEIADNLEFAGVQSESINLIDENVGFSALSDGKITLSWNHANGVSLDNEAVVELVFNATKSGTIAKDLNITSTLLSAEIYDENLETMDIDFVIEGREDIVNDEFVLYQNSPNPFTEATDITFQLPNANTGTLTVFDMTGKVVTRLQRTFEKGHNQITLNRSDLGAAGVLYYQLEVGEYNASSKMILID